MAAITNYPDNSKVSRNEPETTPVENEEPDIIEVHGVRKKQSLGRRFRDTFLASDGREIGDYIFFEVLVPALKDTFSDMVNRGLEMALYKDSAPSRSSRYGRNRESYSYNRSRGRKTSYEPEEERERRISKMDRRSMNFDDVEYDDRKKAEWVLFKMKEKLRIYKNEPVLVRDFYQFSGITPDYTDEYYGWYDLTDAYIETHRHKSYIILPRPEYIYR